MQDLYLQTVTDGKGIVDVERWFVLIIVFVDIDSNFIKKSWTKIVVRAASVIVIDIHKNLQLGKI